MRLRLRKRGQSWEDEAFDERERNGKMGQCESLRERDKKSGEKTLLQGAHSVPRSYRKMSSQYLFELPCRNHFLGMRKSCIRAEKLPWAYRSLSTFIVIQRQCQELIRRSILADNIRTFDLCITFESAQGRPWQVVTLDSISKYTMLNLIYVCYLVLFDILC